RIAHVRTWTFVANRPDWLADPEHWQAVARSVEDKLSDAMHERLTERFVDRRTSVLMRRLRENTTLETEIKKTGEVVVEGHDIGRLDGFTFVADASAAGSEAKALQAAARSALAGEIDARATKLTQAPDREFVLSSDGSVRWTGAPVGKLIAGDDVLRPRLRVIADEQLTGASREAVQTRVDLWLVNHIERLLAPLFALAAADDVTGIARGVAFQLIESIGVLERQKVAEDVKGLDQPSRAVLRKYGVRFGAYHLYLPALLKPAPRSLAAQLWMLKHGGPDDKGLDELQRLASSGRTSIPVDKDTPKPLYRTIGYRVCGERAIRVDILERLADLIRPALAWREGSSGTKPAGAFNGFGFTVTGAMTSLTGASGEDFASILRSLGYRMEKRAKPPEPEPVAAAPEAAPTKGAAPPPVEVASGIATPAAEARETDAAEHAPTLAPDVEPEPAPDEAVASEPPAEAAAPADATPPAEPATPSPAAEAAPSETAPIEAAASGAAPDADSSVPAPAEAAPAEPAMIEVWRPGRPPGERRPREGERPGRRRRHERAGAKPEVQPAGEAPGVAAVEGQAVAADSAQLSEGERKERHGRPRHRRRDRGERKDGGDKGVEGTAAEANPGAEQRADRQGQPERQDRQKRPERRDRPERKEGSSRPPRRDRDRDRDRGGRDDNRPSRIWSSDQQSRGNKEPDPNSPFAKLLALKEQLEGNKER
ncbi:MAG: ATP-dependent helicase, partial [Alphaproteobacteria bacterium]|nr:ATP-dependent helicase [Alphaproteobacteria bacterium]